MQHIPQHYIHTSALVYAHNTEFTQTHNIQECTYWWFLQSGSITHTDMLVDSFASSSPSRTIGLSQGNSVIHEFLDTLNDAPEGKDTP